MNNKILQIASLTINFYYGILSYILIMLRNKQKLKYCKDSDGHNHRYEQVSKEQSKQAELPTSTHPVQLFPTT